MIVIAAKQFAQFEQCTEDNFAKAETEHLAHYDPPLAVSAGRGGLEAAAHLGVHTARRCGWTQGPQIRLFLELMTSFGSRFDSDPMYAWLHPFLDPSSDLPALERSRLLWWHATRYMAQAFGENGLHVIVAGEHASRLDLAMLSKVGQDFAVSGPALLLRLHPERNAFFTAAAARALLERSTGEARRLQLGGLAAQPLLMCLMFNFGHGVADDPLYPGMRQALSQPGLDPEGRTSALYASAHALLAQMLNPIRNARR